MRKYVVVMAAAAAALTVAAPAWAEYPEKNITFVVPFGTGGGFDRTVRLVSPYLEKALPTKVEVIPKNVPGAGGRRGTATVYRAKPDGYTIGIANVPGVALPEITGDDVEYDYNKFTWVARLAQAPYMLVVSAKSSIKSINDLRKLGRPVKFTSTGFGATAYAAGQVMAHEMKIPLQMLAGYKGSAEYILAVVRGDGDATIAPVSVLKKFVEAGDVRALLTTEKESSIKDVPTVASLGFGQFTGLGVDRYVIAPPGLPQAVTKSLSGALIKAMNNPELRAKVEQIGEPFDPLPADQAKVAVAKSIALYAKDKTVLGQQ